MTNGVAVEICVDSVESALAAEAGGADRVELCDNLVEGGTTPGPGSIEAARRHLEIELNVMIRPRGGDFLYSEIEFETMKLDIDAAKRIGVDGVVFGMLDADGSIDVARTQQLVALARPMSVTFHRGFDVSRDPFDSLEALISAGVDRLLTSGQQPNADEGCDLIARLVAVARGRIAIMACGDLDENNIGRIVAETGVNDVHFTAFVETESRMRFRNERVFMGDPSAPSEYLRRVTDAAKVREIIAST